MFKYLRPSRSIRNMLKSTLVRVNSVLERASIRLQPTHYYSETPSRIELASDLTIWANPLPMFGIDWDLDDQLKWTRSMAEPFIAEVRGLQAFKTLASEGAGPGYGPIESQLLHCVIRSIKPNAILEIGSGVSTMVIKRACELNVQDSDRKSSLTCVEPFPRDILINDPDIVLQRERAQSVPRHTFSSLASGDVLFIDSTHAVRTGSELPLLYLDVIPSLPPGVLIHIHDIFLPYYYSPDILWNLFDSQESTLLAALLTNNRQLRVLTCMSALHFDRESELRAIFPDYRPEQFSHGLRARGVEGHFPSSLWLVTQDVSTS